MAAYEPANSDSEDEFFMFVAGRGRRARVFEERANHFQELSDLNFFMRFRLTKPTVLRLLMLIEPSLEYLVERSHSVSPINQLLLALRFYAMGNMLISAGDFAGVSVSTASVIVRKVSAAIARLSAQFIHFPATAAGRIEVQQGFYRMSRFPRVIGAIDCTHIRINSPGGDYAEDFRNRKGWFSLNVQTVCDHRMKIQDIVARWAGTTHDQNIFIQSRLHARLEAQEFGNSVILGDSGYAVQPYLIIPLRNPTLPEEHLFNEAQIRTRGTVERSYGLWKRRFPVLSLGLRLAIPTVQNVIIACAVLHNMAIDMDEAQPPLDPDVAIVDIQGDQIPDNPINGGNAGVQQALVNYFRQLQ